MVRTARSIQQKRQRLRSRDAAGAEKRAEAVASQNYGESKPADSHDESASTLMRVGLYLFVVCIDTREQHGGYQQKRSANDLIPNDAGGLNNVWNDVFGEVLRGRLVESHVAFRLAFVERGGSKEADRGAAFEGIATHYAKPTGRSGPTSQGSRHPNSGA
jgi:hypothetical protein